MKTTITLGSTLLLALTLGGCAGLHVDPINTEAEDLANKGFRYYESSPYLLVHTDNAGGLTGKVIHLPDTTKKTSVTPYAFVSKNDTTLEFKNGVLTSASSEGDATEFPSAVVDALTKVAKASFNVPDSTIPREIPGPYLFKIVVNGNSVSLIGDEPAPAVLSF